MKVKSIFISLVAVVGITMTLLSCSQVPVGYVAVFVPQYGGEKGETADVRGPGVYWVPFGNKVLLFPTFQVNYTFTRDTSEGSPLNEEFVFQTKEGMQCSMDLGVVASYDVSNIGKMVAKYRKGDDEIRSTVIRNAIRDAVNRTASHMAVEYVYGEGKTSFMDSVSSTVAASLKPYGILIERVNLINSIRIPESVTRTLNSKVEATQLAQKAENEVRTAEAKAKIRIAEAEGEASSMLIKAKAEAEANRIRQQSLTPLLIQQQWIEKWDGKVPTVSTGTGQGLILNMK